MTRSKIPERLYRVKRETTCLGGIQVEWSKIVLASSASEAVSLSLTDTEKGWTGQPRVPLPPDVASLQPPRALRELGKLKMVRSERLLPSEVRAYNNRVSKVK